MSNSDIPICLANRNIVSFSIEGITYTTTIQKLRAILQRHLSILELNDGNNNPTVLMYYPENSNFLLVKSLKTQNFLHLPISKIDVIILKWKSILETDFGRDKTLDELELLDTKLEQNELRRKERPWPPELNERGVDKYLVENRRRGWQEEIIRNDDRKKYLTSKWGSNKSLYALEKLEEQQKESERLMRVKTERKIDLENKFGVGKSLQELENLEDIDNSKNERLAKEAIKVIKKMENEEIKLRREMFD